jgi:hypothetical protein
MGAVPAFAFSWGTLGARRFFMVWSRGECGVSLPKHSSGAAGGAFWEGHPAIAHASGFGSAFPRNRRFIAKRNG